MSTSGERSARHRASESVSGARKLELAEHRREQIDRCIEIGLVHHLCHRVDVARAWTKCNATRSAASPLNRSRVLSAARQHGALIGNAVALGNGARPFRSRPGGGESYKEAACGAGVMPECRIGTGIIQAQTEVVVQVGCFFKCRVRVKSSCSSFIQCASSFPPLSVQGSSSRALTLPKPAPRRALTLPKPAPRHARHHHS